MAGSTIRGQSRAPASQLAYAVRPIPGGGVPEITFSTGAARNLQRFSNDLLQLQNAAHDQLDAQADAEGQFEGAIAGATGTPSLKEWGTVRGRAYNKAAVEAFTTTLETNMINKVGELSGKYFGDPEGLKAALSGYENGVVGEVGKFYPPAAAAMRQRIAIRGNAALAQARDDAFKINRDRHEAALITNEAALNAEIDGLSSRLFSDNPEVSSSAMIGLGQLRAQVMTIYDAADATGKPLFDQAEKAKALQKLQTRIFEKATLSWFEAQPDKAEAYRKFTAGEFTVKFNSIGDINPPPSGKVPRGVRNNNPGNIEAGSFTRGHGATGSDGRFAKFSTPAEGIQAMGALLQSYQARGLDTVEKIIGRWAPPRENNTQGYANRVASALGISADTAVDLKDADTLAVFIGAMTEVENGYSPYSGEYIKASVVGTANQPEEGSTTVVDVRKTLPPEKLTALEADMRASITFNNSIADRNERLEEKALKQTQEDADFSFGFRFYAQPGEKDPSTGEAVKPLTFEEVHKAVRDQALSPSAGKALLKAMTTEETEKSDDTIYKTAVRKINEGEDVTSFLQENITLLTKNDYRTLANQNNTANVRGAGTLTERQNVYLRQLQDLMTPDVLTGKFDQYQEERKFEALIEYRNRVAEGEPPEAVARDIADRAKRNIQTMASNELDGLVYPRFSVRTENGRVDVAESYRALKAARETGAMSAASADRQIVLLKKWRDLQELIDKRDVIK